MLDIHTSSNDPWLLRHAARLTRSLKHWTGRDLVLTGDDVEVFNRIMNAPFVLVSHDTSDDPVLNFANMSAMQLWEMDWQTLTSTPSRLTAEQPLRDERERLLQRVKQFGFIDDYSGIRISKTGRRFMIRNATVWNLIDENNQHCGQAAMFGEWEMI